MKIISNLNCSGVYKYYQTDHFNIKCDNYCLTFSDYVCIFLILKKNLFEWRHKNDRVANSEASSVEETSDFFDKKLSGTSQVGRAALVEDLLQVEGVRFE